MVADPVRRIEAVEPLPEFRRDGLGYVYEPADVAVRLRVDYVKRHGDELRGEVKVTLRANDGHLHQANLNLSSTTARNTLSKHLEGVTRRQDGTNPVKWAPIVEAFSVGVMEAHRVGDPFLTLADVDPDIEHADLIETVQPFGAATMVYAQGGTGKGWYSVRLAVSAATGIPFGTLRVSRSVNVVILDWEDRPSVIAGRLRDVCRGMDVPVPRNIRYRRCRGPLAGQIHQVAAEMSAHNEELVIVDSVEKASGSGGDSQTYQDRAAMLFDALDLLGDVSILLIDHTAAAAASKENQNQVNKAYGSTFKTNWARLAFEMRSHQEYDSPISFIALHLFKTNHGPKLKPIGFRYDWSTPGRFVLSSWDVSDLPELMAPTTNEEKCYQALRSGPLSNAMLAEEVGLSKPQTRVVCARSKRIERLDKERWQLADRPVLRVQGETSRFRPPHANDDDSLSF